MLPCALSACRAVPNNNNNNNNNNSNNNNLNFHADVFSSAMRLHWKEGYIPPFWGGVY